MSLIGRSPELGKSKLNMKLDMNLAVCDQHSNTMQVTPSHSSSLKIIDEPRHVASEESSAESDKSDELGEKASYRQNRQF